VFGIARKDKDVAEVEAASAGAVQMSMCDVTDEAAVNTWARSVSSALGPSGLDVLVSNAGILTVGPTETIPLHSVRYAFEVNIFGIDFVMARPGNMATGGPAKATTDLQEASDSMAPEQRSLYGTEFGAAAAAALDEMQHHGLEAAPAADYVINAIQPTPAPIGVAMGSRSREHSEACPREDRCRTRRHAPSVPWPRRLMPGTGRNRLKTAAPPS
jgi:NAD(P)-dependent dehydrogenase (short-subunit alcohol dehydrogenase family)